MRLGEFDCGCNNRKFVMFEAGKLGIYEAGLLAISVTAIVLAWRLNNA